MSKAHARLSAARTAGASDNLRDAPTTAAAAAACAPPACLIPGMMAFSTPMERGWYTTKDQKPPVRDSVAFVGALSGAARERLCRRRCALVKSLDACAAGARPGPGCSRHTTARIAKMDLNDRLLYLPAPNQLCSAQRSHAC